MGPLESDNSSSIDSSASTWPSVNSEQFYPKKVNIFATHTEKREFVSQQESAALALLQSTTRLLPNGHYESGLLWKTLPPSLPDNGAGALKLLYANETRCRHDEDYCSVLVAAIEKHQAQGYSKKLEHHELSSPSGRTWYLPYYMVPHPRRPEKPKRLVFDASRQFQGRSLNDELHTKPDLLTSLFSVLLRFRENPFAVSMDIVKMFWQVGVKSEDRPALRYLYRRPGSKAPPETFEMQTHIFGAGSSMTTCVYALQQTGRDNPGYADIVENLSTVFMSTINSTHSHLRMKPSMCALVSLNC